MLYWLYFRHYCKSFPLPHPRNPSAGDKESLGVYVLEGCERYGPETTCIPLAFFWWWAKCIYWTLVQSNLSLFLSLSPDIGNWEKIQASLLRSSAKPLHPFPIFHEHKQMGTAPVILCIVVSMTLLLEPRWPSQTLKKATWNWFKKP